MVPEAPSTEALVAARPELVGAAALLLQWPSPNDSVYDVDAIERLRPPLIIALWACCGAAGGSVFGFEVPVR